MQTEKRGTKIFEGDVTPEEVLAEIERDVSKRNPNIGAIQSIYLKQGPQTFKFAIIYQILNASTGEHHHLSLTLQSFKRLKVGWFKQEERIIQLDDEEQDEIGFLIKFIAEFTKGIPIEREKYGLLKQEDYDKYIAAIEGKTSVDDILEDADKYHEIIEKGNIHLFKDLFSWIMSSGNSKEIVERLQELDISSLEDISSLSGIAQLKEFRKIWDAESENGDEEFWQRTFSNFSWSISQLFTYPLILFAEKAYLGGKSVINKKGNLVDFIFLNALSNNVMLIEIKTPTSDLLSSKYRQTFSVSAELSGGINQALKYKHKVLRHYATLTADADENEKFEAFNPKGVLIIGNYKKEINDLIKKEAFELFRSNLSNIEVITFDELFKKVDLLLEILENKIEEENAAKQRS